MPPPARRPLLQDELRTALISYFKLGQPGGKSYQRFDELMQALDEDQEGEAVEWAKVFEEDREFNQGAAWHGGSSRVL